MHCSPSPPSPPHQPTLAEGFVTGIGGSCLAAPAPCLLLFGGVTCMVGIIVVDPKDSEGWGLHSGVLSLLITFVVLLE